MADEIFKEIQNLPPEQRWSALQFLMMKRTRAAKTPSHCTFELTPRCTLSCVMCYVIDEAKSDIGYSELRTEQWIHLIREAIELGVESITLTGGEPLIRSDFLEIYDAAYNAGLRITIMSNGTLFNDEIISHLLRKPPHQICITLYGISENTYEIQCHNAKGFHAAIDSIIRIKESGLPLVLQTTMTKYNEKDIPEIVRFAERYSIPYRYNGNLFSARKCTTKCVKSILSDDNKERQNRQVVI